jgi:hypothetical protein
MIRTVLCILCVLCAFTGTAKAQFVLEQGKVSLAVSGGERLNGFVTIHNNSKEEALLKVYWEDFEYITPYDGSKSFAPAGTLPSTASQWISYSPQEFKISGFGAQKVQYTISVPEKVEGGHYGVLFFERVNSDVKTTTGVKVVYRMGSLFFIEAKDKIKQAVFNAMKIAAGSLTGALTNQGNAVLVPRTTYYIMDQDGLVADRGDVKNLYIPPGVTAPFSIALPAGLQPGAYTFFVNADLEEGDVVVQEIAFSKDAAGRITMGHTGP